MQTLTEQDKTSAMVRMLALVPDVVSFDACIKAIDPAPVRMKGIARTPDGSLPKGRKSVRVLVAEAGSPLPPASAPDAREARARFIIDLLGIDLLAKRPVREMLIKNLDRQTLESFVTDFPPIGPLPGDVAAIRSRIAGYRWHAGKSWAACFTGILGMPSVFRGLRGEPPLPETEEVEAFRALPGLMDFQLELVDRLKALLEATKQGNRGVLTMPTGSGKTRTLVEAVLSWWATTRKGKGKILWIAQSEELCEQAVQAFRQVWTDLGHRGVVSGKVLGIGRLWSTRPVHDECDVLVASIQKLAALVEKGDLPPGQDVRPSLDELAALDRWKSELAAILVDEAHHGVATSYKSVLTYLGIDFSRHGMSDIPVIGLTATPYRRDDIESKMLADYFQNRLLTPASVGDNPLKALRDMGVLARPEHQVLKMPGRTRLTNDQTKYIDQWRQVPPDLLSKLGDSATRNKVLLEAMLRMDEDWSVLFFGCTVQHAQAMAAMLRRHGRKAEAVLGDTRPSTRRSLIERFRRGEIRILCNYGVLTTGFDAPRVQAVVVGRPTISPVLYEQMIGRGMRGPHFGGTDTCLVVDVEDNLSFGGQMAWQRCLKMGYWDVDPPSWEELRIPQDGGRADEDLPGDRERNALERLETLDLIHLDSNFRERWLAFGLGLSGTCFLRDHLIRELRRRCDATIPDHVLIEPFRNLVEANDLVCSVESGLEPTSGRLERPFKGVGEPEQLHLVAHLAEMQSVPGARDVLREALQSTWVDDRMRG